MEKKEKIIIKYPEPISIEGLEIILQQMKNCICKIHRNDGIEGIGFFTKIPFENELLPVLITNNHILSKNDINYNNIIRITFYNDKECRNIKIGNSRKIYHNEFYDITIVEIKPDIDQISKYIELDEGIYIDNIYNNKSIYILNYNKGKNIEISYGLLINIESNDDIYYFSNIENHSLIKPIISFDNSKIMGIQCNSLNKQFNKGKSIKYFITEFNKVNTEKNKYLNEITIKYDLKNVNESIKLFGSNFVENNKNNFKMIIEQEEKDICEYYKINKKLKKKGILEIKLVIRIININNKNFFFYKNKHKNISKLYNNKLGNNYYLDLSYMFYGCEYLSSLPDIYKIDTEYINNMSNMFYGCKSLLSLPDLSKWNTKNIKNMSGMFRNCSSLKYLPDISSWNIKNVTNMSRLFNGCNELISLPDISKWETGNVRDISYMFCGCLKLSSLPNISKWDTKKIKNMSYIFNYCSSLLLLPDISKWNTQNVEDMCCMFRFCPLSTLPDISKWNVEKVLNMSQMFCGCFSLSSLPDISKWKIHKLLNKSEMFSQCDRELKIPSKFRYNSEDNSLNVII